ARPPVTRHYGRAGAAASPDPALSLAHRAVPQPPAPSLALPTLLTDLRYIRQHDHAVAWSSRGLTAPAMVPMTALWNGGSVAPDADGVDELVAAGYATREPVALTPAGEEVRDAIEAETNERAQVSFDVLDDTEGQAFLDALRSLPGTVPA